MSGIGNVGTILVLAGVSALLAASPARSQPALTFQQEFLQRIAPDTLLDKYLEAAKVNFLVADADGDGKITQRDIDLHTLMGDVSARNEALRRVLRYDLDGDGFVTEDEVRRIATYDARAQIAIFGEDKSSNPKPSAAEIVARQIDVTVRSTMALDTDKDGKVSLAEGGKVERSDRSRGPNSLAERARQLLKLDGVVNGELTLAAFQAAVEALFRQVDTDKNGVISQQELTDYRTRAEQAGCEMPAASDTAKLVVLSSFQTEALSSVALGSQDIAINAGRVVVEPGTDPLYVVIASNAPTIWQFSGAVERVERVVMSSVSNAPNSADPSRPALVGATGIANEKVSFFAKLNCVRHFDVAPSSVSAQSVATIRAVTGKTPETVAAKYTVFGFRVPSGIIESVNTEFVKSERGKDVITIEKPQGTFMPSGSAGSLVVQAKPSRARDEMYRFSPGGVIEIDPKTVVGSAPAVSYEVLPQQAGLVQLMASGALTQNSLGEYIVREKMRFPGGLYGARSVTFLVLNGTPYPDGDPGHSCVVMEETGQKKGAACRP
jgi:Ca2+-binding EF-hand superfamily protein